MATLQEKRVSHSASTKKRKRSDSAASNCETDDEFLMKHGCDNDSDSDSDRDTDNINNTVLNKPILPNKCTECTTLVMCVKCSHDFRKREGDIMNNLTIINNTNNDKNAIMRSSMKKSAHSRFSKKTEIISNFKNKHKVKSISKPKSLLKPQNTAVHSDNTDMDTGGEEKHNNMDKIDSNVNVNMNVNINANVNADSTVDNEMDKTEAITLADHKKQHREQKRLLKKQRIEQSSDGAVDLSKSKYSPARLCDLTKHFLSMFPNAGEGTINLKEALKALDLRRRRLYDVVNVLVGANAIQKVERDIYVRLTTPLVAFGEVFKSSSSVSTIPPSP